MSGLKRAINTLRYGVARDGVELMKFLDDPSRERCHLVLCQNSAQPASTKELRLSKSG